MFLKYNRFDFSNFPWYFVILLLLHSSMASGEKAETKLRNLLLKDYVPELLPETNANGSVDVLITTFVRTMEPQLQNFVNLKAVLLFQWNDSRLRYEDQNPENIKKLSLQGDEIWVPDLTVYNMHTSQKLLDHSTRCSVNPTGLLRCSQKVSLYLYCELNYTDWPHDTQLCSLHIGTWIEEKVHLKPWLKSDGIIMTAGKKTPKWILKEIIYIPEEVSGPVTSMEYSFKIQRVDKGHFAQFIVPANVVATLSLCAFWMPRDKGMVRVGFSLAVLMLNALFIQDLGFIFWLSGGDFLPKICLFYRDGIYVNIYTLTVSVLLRFMCTRSAEIPSYLASTSTFLNSSPTSRTLLGLPAKASPWHPLAALLDRAAFFSVLFFNIYALANLVPK